MKNVYIILALFTVFSRGAEVSYENGTSISAKIVRALIEKKPSEEIIPLIQDENVTSEELNRIGYNGRLALVVACAKARYDIMEELLQKGANPNLSDLNGWTPLKLAIRSSSMPNWYERIKLLLDYEADPDGIDYHAEAEAEVIPQSMERLFEHHALRKRRRQWMQIVGNPCIERSQSSNCLCIDKKH